ncbi:MAG: patatin-like phospholipase family protein [Bdellovibrionales bacterium]|nr:patatin-like phospholipase family protein [Bdellovibrionales bacterium]
MNLGLVLTGGGARAAYQVGVLKAIAEMTQAKESPFKVISGVSAGAINAAYLMSRADQFGIATQGLWDLWTRLHSERVYRTDPASIASLGSKWLRTVGMGGVFNQKRANHLLSTEPLRELLAQELSLERIPGFIKNQSLKGIALSATNYLTGTAITFFDGDDSISEWVRSTRLGVRTTVAIDHVMASSAIPVFFPPIRIDGALYGDGCIRLTSPVSPAIHLGADRILCVGIRYFRTHEQTIDLNRNLKRDDLSIADIGGVLLNAVFLDSLETDIERLERINRTLSIMTDEQKRKMASPLKTIPVMALRPSQDLGHLARGTLKEFPTLIRFLLKGVGAKEDKGWDLVSYLAFEKAYTQQLAELGYSDTLRKKESVLEFLFGDPSRVQSELAR